MRESGQPFDLHSLGVLDGLGGTPLKEVYAKHAKRDFDDGMGMRYEVNRLA